MLKKTLKIKIRDLMYNGNTEELTLDEAFLKALSHSEGGDHPQNVFENDLLNFINKYPELVLHLKNEYKLAMLICWGYEIQVIQEEN